MPAPQTLSNHHAGVISSEVGPRRSKQHTRFNPIQPEQQVRQDKRRGRRHGAMNYTTDEVNTFLDLIDKELPVGGKGWAVVGARFRDTAQTNGFPQRSDQSLKVKFGQVWG